MRAQGLDGLDASVYLERMRDETVECGVDEERQSRNVVEVRVGEKHVTDLAQLGEREITEAGAGIDQYVVVDQD